VASRTVMVVGKLVENAAHSLRQLLVQAGLLAEGYDTRQFMAACRAYREKFGELKAFSTYKQPSYINWDDEKYQGDAYGAYAWAVYVAEVSVDLTTYEVKVDDFVALQEVGKVVHPIFAAGQIEGGVAQGIGYAIYEKVIWKDGRMANNRMTNYIVPTAADTPPIRVFFEEHPYENGPSGAKGIGELPMDGPAPAILNGVEMATGKPVNAIPLLPEDMMRWWS
jgi:CO/xanthine dehydrogenase Mo-binding subunit